MKTRLLIVCLALIFSGSQVFAQLSKAEKKEWKKKAKEYAKNPASLKDFTEAKQSAENNLTQLNGQMKQLQSSISDKKRKDCRAGRTRLPACAANSLPRKRSWPNSGKTPWSARWTSPKA